MICIWFYSMDSNEEFDAAFTSAQSKRQAVDPLGTAIELLFGADTPAFTTTFVRWFSG